MASQHTRQMEEALARVCDAVEAARARAESRSGFHTEARPQYAPGGHVGVAVALVDEVVSDLADHAETLAAEADAAAREVEALRL